ncbi:ead/Ea22-like family protein [Salmonella enterica subsp. enterica serovar Typhimurium]|nr:hypothetical protein [Salmonella enterica subsp. enterica serovar Typhimurium]EAB4465333.1 ead/Ea22-like family protein [Salmonella enterica]ECU7639006.1 ead/Ea22-like family protein [Salmonella enterica subsp. enterica serovar 4,[5],12:i:-]EAA6228733.1 ead/Ea22-like family protein [Salmonella enterica subsp. enterica serovar Typhimurium]EAB7241102.1 ead/Ea22-like family protein [Salmonella enterica subsp. enterica serovar Typhimurium]
MTALNKQALRERYSSQPVPKCHICGAEMTIQRAGGGSLVYGCTGRVDSDGEGYVFAEGRDFADNHYALSRVTVANNSDPDVLALLDELEAAQKYAKDRDAENEDLMLTVGRLRMEKEAAEKRIAETNQRNTELVMKIEPMDRRIAELEARTPYGYLRQCDGQIQISIGSERPHDRSGGYATPWFAIYTAAGIGVKGE